MITIDVEKAKLIKLAVAVVVILVVYVRWIVKK